MRLNKHTHSYIHIERVQIQIFVLNTEVFTFAIPIKFILCKINFLVALLRVVNTLYIKKLQKMISATPDISPSLIQRFLRQVCFRKL